MLSTASKRRLVSVLVVKLMNEVVETRERRSRFMTWQANKHGSPEGAHTLKGTLPME